MATTASVAAANTKPHTRGGELSKTDGGLKTSFSADTTSKAPTANCNDRITGSVNRRASQLAIPLTAMRSRITPI